MRGIVWMVVAALGLSALGLGLIFGLRTARLDEGAVIAHYAQRYADDTGGVPEQCIGLPGQGRVWLRVVCNGPVPRIYAISRLGFARIVPPPDGI